MPNPSTNKDSGSYHYPKGWLITAFRNLRVSPQEHAVMTQHFRETYKERHQELPGTPYFGSREVAYGNYDRIQITPVEHLYDFTRVANQTHDWLGSNQSILLYKWRDDEKNRCFRAKKDESGKTKIVVLDEDGKERKKEFSAVTFCYISDGIRSRTESSYKDLLNQCEKSICALVEAFNLRVSRLPKGSVHNPVAAEVFGSLSAAEIVILWSARQYTDVMYLIDCVRDFECCWETETPKLFRTTYTLITFPDAVSRDDDINRWEDMRRNSEDWKLKDVQGEAQIMFATQDGAGEETFQGFKQFFGDCLRNAGAMLGENPAETLGADPDEKYPITPCSGEYDLLVKVPSRYITRLFCNPQIWHMEQDSEWMKNPTGQDAACSVYHPVFNRYILYSFTRLTYRKNCDLPAFARGDDHVWNEMRKLLECVNDMRLKEADELNGQTLNEAVETDKKLLDGLLKEVRGRIPRNSNLNMELNQLFNDYTQCMCASADGLWIADYRELYRQILEQLRRIVSQMDDREMDDRESGDWKAGADTNHAAIIKDINRLIRALHKQTNHITTSSKQLFREQETHFGYTAQHDLVLHAYYDMVKYLMQAIYSYSDKSFQSPLYPLVNFRAGDHIQSRCFFEEGARSYLKTGAAKHLHPRVIVIDMPLDGMDNLMYYIPMMVHEVFHYAAPWNRRKRNQTLTKIAVFLALNHSLASIFNELFRARLEKAEQSKPEAQRRDSEQLRLVVRNAGEQFQNGMMVPIRSFVETHLEEMYRSLESTFFIAELARMNKKELDALGELLNLNELQKGMILRSWFLAWLENWLCGDGKGVADNGKTVEHRGLDDFFGPLFRFLSDEPSVLLEAKQDAAEAPEEYRSDLNVYNVVIDQIREQIDDALKDVDAVSKDSNSITQRMMTGVQDYTDSDRHSLFHDLMKQLDELFPDIAMATLTDMPASGYMLQIALDLDKKMFSCDNSVIMNDIRFAAILRWLIDRRCRESGEDLETCLERELKSFRKLYRASYEIIAYTSTIGETDKGERLSRDAIRWSNAFQDAFERYSSTDRIRGMIGWIDELIQEQMLPCLQMEEDTEENLRIKASLSELFQTPYNQYLKLLLEKEVGEELLGELFRLSIQTILRFQRHQSLKRLNEEFPAKRRIEVKSTTSDKTPVIYRKEYIATLTAQENLLRVVQYAVNMLYRYRKKDNLSTSTGMWYRGVSNAEHTALPSGFVHFAEDAGWLNGGLSGKPVFTYLDAQRHNYETFRYSAEGSSPDVSPAQYQCTMNYLTLMQHYGQHTNLMDWSEDFFAATYFALEEQIKLNDCYPHQRNKKIKDADKNAALYILDPVRFNRACEEIENELDGLFVLNMGSPDSTPPMTKVPNLSIPENQAQMREYHELYPDSDIWNKDRYGLITLPKPETGEEANKTVTLTDIKNNLELPEKLPMHLPRAVYAAKLNARIRAQSGLFIAYSLLSPPVAWEEKDKEKEKVVTNEVNDGPFHYLGLEQIQDYYLQMDRGNRPFLFKIKLPASMKKTWGGSFYRFGLSTERIYPELQNNRNR